jgi:hypothetical protein
LRPEGSSVFAAGFRFYFFTGEMSAMSDFHHGMKPLGIRKCLTELWLEMVVRMAVEIISSMGDYSSSRP